MLQDLQRLSADDMEGRAVGTPGGARARAYLLARFKAAGLAPFGTSHEVPFERRGERDPGVNVIGYIPGTAAPERFIVVSAHYDHVGVRGGRIFNGANDNASGAAALPAIAGYFRAHRPAHSILIAAFDAEESGLLGARAFVARPPVDRDAILINVNLDMIGRDPSNTLWVVGTRQQPALKPLIERVASRAPVQLRMGYDDPRQGSEKDWTRDSDQWAFLEAGIPALFFSVEDYALHHEPDDDYESMTLEFYARAVETIVSTILEIDANAAIVTAPR